VYDGSNNLFMLFEYANDRMPVAMTKGSSTYYLTYDQVGSLRIVADALGNVVKRLDYDSFGNIIEDSGPAFEVPFGFAGGLYDLDTRLIKFGFRDYDPDAGRWTAKDPFFFAGGDTNLYGYVLNNPLNLFDLWGLDPFSTPGSYLGEASRVPQNWSSFPGYEFPTIDPKQIKLYHDIQDAAGEIHGAINSIPPGQSTGDPYTDLAIQLYQIFSEIYGRCK
jgi:RHS repeat-associated protein